MSVFYGSGSYFDHDQNDKNISNNEENEKLKRSNEIFRLNYSQNSSLKCTGKTRGEFLEDSEQSLMGKGKDAPNVFQSSKFENEKSSNVSEHLKNDLSEVETNIPIFNKKCLKKSGKPLTKADIGRQNYKNVDFNSFLQKNANRKKKPTILQQSRSNWDSFKVEEGISEDIALAQFNKGKKGYLEKQIFLHKCQWKSFEIEKNMRLSRCALKSRENEF